jgi:hypothetical protein
MGKGNDKEVDGEKSKELKLQQFKTKNRKDNMIGRSG